MTETARGNTGRFLLPSALLPPAFAGSSPSNSGKMMPATSFLRQFGFVLPLVALAACGQTDVSLEGRDFAVDQTAQPASLPLPPQDVSELVRASGPSYVTLTVSKEEDEGGGDKSSGKRGNAIASGSGFLADGEGHVLTAAHVAGAAGNEIAARAANGRVYSGRVVAILPGNDMALIKLRGISGRPVSPTANNCLSASTMVFSLGRPHAQGDTARVGEVENMHFGRPVQYGKFGYPDAMVLKMNTQKGESGGPLFDGTGRLVGMVVSTLTDAQGQPLHLAHAVPATSLAGFLCGNIACAPDWQALAVQSTNSCP